jgi:maltose/moltooligosaccharide transporter
MLAYGIGWLVDRFNALRVSIAMLLLAGTAYIAGFLLVHDITSFSIVFVLHTVLSGAFFTAVASLPMMLFPKLRFSQFASAANMMRGFAVLLVSVIQGPVIDWSGRDYKLSLLGSGVFAFAAAAAGALLMRRISRNQPGDLP